MNFKNWLLLVEDAAEKALAKSLVGDDETVFNQLKSAIPEKQKQADKILILAAYYYSKEKDLERIKKDIKDYIELLNNNKMTLTAVDPKTGKPSIDYAQWINIIHGHQGEAAAKQRKNFQVTDQDFQKERPIFTNPDGTIKVYKANSPQQCIILGKGHTFCISQPGNTMWKSYRDSKISTFYFVKDGSRQDELSTVVVDMTRRGPELTDVANNTGTTLDPYTGESTTDPSSYFKYLQEKGVNTKIFENIPKTPEEEKENEKLGRKNHDLNWFINLPHTDKSKYIGRGHLLSDEQFDYLFNNKFNSLLEQYARTGLKLTNYQIDKILENKDLKDKYIHNRLAAQQHDFNINQKEWKVLTDQQKKDLIPQIPSYEIIQLLASFGEMELLKKEVEDGTQVHQKDIGSAATPEIEEYLKLKSGFAVDNSALRDDLDELKQIVEKGGKIGNRSVENAASTGNLDAVKYLIGKGGKITDGTIGNAALTGNFELVKFIVNEIEKTNHSIGHMYNMIGDAVAHAVGRGGLDVVKYLIEKGGRIGDNAALNAIENRKLDVLKYLILDRKMEMPDYALPLAIDTKDKEIIDFVMKHITPQNLMGYVMHILRDTTSKYEMDQFMNVLDRLLQNKEIHYAFSRALPVFDKIAKNREVYDHMASRLHSN